MEKKVIKENELKKINGGGTDTTTCEDCETYTKLIQNRALSCPKEKTCTIKYCKFKN